MMALISALLVAHASPRVWASCQTGQNDILAALSASGVEVVRCKTPEAAIDKAPSGAATLILAGGTAGRPAEINAACLERAEKKGLKLYVEFAYLPGDERKEPVKPQWERTVVSSPEFGPGLAEMRILSTHATPFLPRRVPRPWLVVGRVAGFDTAVFGLPKDASALLYQAKPGLIVATANLSEFLTGRYAPSAAWVQVWKTILAHLGIEGVNLNAHASVRPAYDRGAKLNKDAEAKAAKLGRRWFTNAKMLIDASWTDQYARAGAYPDRVVPPGVMEGFSSTIETDGSQPERWWVRADCNGETAMAFALSRDKTEQKIGANIADFLLFKSVQTQAERSDPQHASCGLIGWNNVEKYWGNLDGFKVFYGDDNARAILGIMAAAGALKIDRWDEGILRTLLGNLRTTGKLGFRTDRLEQDDVEKNGWRAYWDGAPVNYAPHFEAYSWACFLWAYDKTKFKPFLDRTLAGIKATMEVDRKQWRWGGGTIELSRMLLPLAWLVRVDDTPEHRRWLTSVADALIADQDASGALIEKLGNLSGDYFGAPRSNEAYGTTETPIIQENGDPLADNLYSCNFAFLGLNEAYAATKDVRYKEACDKLAGFLCRIQIRSKGRPELDGAWFRAFDFRNWDYWGSNGDAGWGAWSIESGWTVTWIVSVLEMRRTGTSLWDLTASSQIQKQMAKLRPLMMPGIE
jgi:hypothetical protein